MRNHDDHIHIRSPSARAGSQESEREAENAEKKRKRKGREQEKEKKSPDPASKRLDSEPKRNKLLRELVAVVALPRSFVPPFFL